MIDAFETVEEAKAYRYGRWAGNPSGWDYTEKQCAWQVYDAISRHFYQCLRKPGHGPGNLYCKQHAAYAEHAIASRKAKGERGGE